MADVPKIVRERLRAPSPAGSHPDADLLTAYSEQLLPERERTTVLEHLSRCADCREVVALALPANEVVQALPRPSRSWLAWPAFRWGFASAGLAVIAIFASLQYRHQSRPESALKTAAPVMQAKTEPTPPISVDEGKAAPSGQKAKSDVSKDAAAMHVDTFMVANKRADTAATANQPTVGGLVISRDKLSHGPLQSNQWQQQNAHAKQAPGPERVPDQPAASAPAPAPPAPQAYAVQSAPSHGDRRTQNLDLAVNSQTSMQLTQLEAQGGPAEAEVEKAKPAVAGTAPKTAADGDSSAIQGRAGKALTINTPRWTINSSGGLQRSYDQGISWQDVSVASAPPSANAAMELSAAPSRARAASSPASALAKKEQPSPPVFRTVAANGLEVWAGGANGLLYHSTDAGAHWTHVVPSSGGAVVAGDILTIEFTDAQHGKVVTSAGETWITSDRGLTWQRQ